MAPARAQTVLPHGLDFVTTLEEARTRLLQLRNSGVISQDEMMTLSQQLEPRLRGYTMNDWRVADSRKSVTGVERGGSNPTAGRGIFSDEDLQTKSLQQYDDLLQKVKQGHYTIVEDTGYRFKIKELDTIVWKPTDATHDQILGDVSQAGHDQARAGRNDHSRYRRRARRNTSSEFGGGAASKDHRALSPIEPGARGGARWTGADSPTPSAV